MKAKKVMALMLCAAMVTSMSATAAFAAEEKEDAATEESADSTAAEDPTAQFDGLKANEAYEFPMMVKSFQSTYWDAAQEGMKKAAEELGVTYTAQGPKMCIRDSPDSRPFSVEEFMDTYRQCEELVEKGKIRYIGISNMTIPKLEAVLPLMKIKPAACELELHPCFQQQEQYDYLVAHNIQPVGYMPLGSPRRPERDICPEDVADMQTPEMQEIAKAHGVHPALIALKWAHQRGEISIPFSVHNYVSNLKCVTEDPLTDEEMAKIGTLEKGNRLVKGQVFLWEGAKDWHDLWDEEGYIVK